MSSQTAHTMTADCGTEELRAFTHYFDT